MLLLFWGTSILLASLGRALRGLPLWLSLLALSLLVLYMAVHWAAALNSGDQVRRPPHSSVSPSSRAAAWERFSPSSRILEIIAVSIFSAADCARAVPVQTTRQRTKANCLIGKGDPGYEWKPLKNAA